MTSRREIPLQDLRIADLATFLAVRRTGSITAAAHEMHVTPSQVSKAIARLEACAHLQLLSRSSRGVTLSEAGHRMLPHVESALAALRMMRQRIDQQSTPLTIAGPSFLITTLLPAIASCQPRLRVRSLELPPSLVRAHAAENFFDFALLSDGVSRLPSTWVAERVGTLRKALFGSPAFAKKLGPAPVGPERIRDVPFIGPLYISGGQFVAGDDDCPLAVEDRVLGHQTQTFQTALAIAGCTEQLVFGPEIGARGAVERREVVEIRVKGWDVSEELYLACDADRVKAKIRAAAAQAVRDALA